MLKKIFAVAIVLLFVFSLTACGGNGSSTDNAADSPLLGRWEEEGRPNYSFFTLEFFSDGAIFTGNDREGMRFATWRADGNRLGIDGAGVSGAWYFNISRNTLTLERVDSWDNTTIITRTFERVR